MIHDSLPQTLTKENLAKWITENCIDKKMHEEKIELDDKEIQDLEHRSSIASRQIDKLERQAKEIANHFKDGTSEPIHITIPFTKGLKALTANREFADNCIELGYTKEETVLFGIPYPEKNVVIFVDSEGIEYPTYQENMTSEQARAYNTLFKEEESLQESVSKQQKQKKKKPATQTLGEKYHITNDKEGFIVTPRDSDDLPPSDIGGDKDLINPFA